MGKDTPSTTTYDLLLAVIPLLLQLHRRLLESPVPAVGELDSNLRTFLTTVHQAVRHFDPSFPPFEVPTGESPYERPPPREEPTPGPSRQRWGKDTTRPAPLPPNSLRKRLTCGAQQSRRGGILQRNRIRHKTYRQSSSSATMRLPKEYARMYDLCNNCLKEGHYARDCDQLANTQCSWCGEMGHRVSHCPLKKTFDESFMNGRKDEDEAPN